MNWANTPLLPFIFHAESITLSPSRVMLCFYDSLSHLLRHNRAFWYSRPIISVLHLQFFDEVFILPRNIFIDFVFRYLSLPACPSELLSIVNFGIFIPVFLFFNAMYLMRILVFMENDGIRRWNIVKSSYLQSITYDHETYLQLIFVQGFIINRAKC